ncbi:MAG: hydrogenase iron-sulfur subunit [Thermodesulfobacteriota bacterium]
MTVENTSSAVNKPRIGVWICDCQGRVSTNVDTVSLVERAREMDGVVTVRRVDALCNTEELARLRAELKENNINRFLFAGCSARSSLRFPEQQISAVLESTEIDKAMFEVANIREQCAWVHDDRKAATAKALDVLRMAYVRLKLDTPRAPATKIVPRSLVIGGGPAGLQTAQDLAVLGQQVTLVEQASYLGGRMCQIPFLFQTENWPGRCVSTCVGPVQAAGSMFHPNVECLTSSEVADIERVDGNFRARLRLGARFVDAEKCISCGKCAEVCPEEIESEFDEGLFSRKAIDKDFPRAVPDAYNILERACTMCGKCVEVCPAGAINLAAQAEEKEEDFGAVFLSTGFDTYDLSRNREFNYGLPDVMSGMEFERLLDRGVLRPSNGQTPRHIVFVLCAGSRATRDKRGEGVSYCSKTCCGITMKQVERLGLTMNETDITVIYYYDIRAYERTFEAMYDHVKRMGIDFLQGEIEGITGSDDGVKIRVARLEDGSTSAGAAHTFDAEGFVTLDADLVVLASAQTPRREAQPLVRKLGLQTDQFGFPMENQPRIFRPTESFVDRVYVVGAAAGPKVVQQSVEQGSAAAMKAAPHLIKGEKDLLKFVSRIDPAACVRCRICETVCPHGAIKITEKGALSDPAFCQGCGFCIAACPTHAAELINFTEQQILDQIDVAFQGVPPGAPKILALLCYWCSYCGADLAGASGLKLPVNYRSIRIRCSSSVNSALVMEMFRRGVDGIFVGGCPPGSCHHVNGNYLTDKRTSLMQKLMAQLGLSERRLKFDYIGVPHSQKFADTITAMDRDLRELGPNPVAVNTSERSETHGR